MARVLGLVSFRVYPTHMGGQKGVALFYEYLQQHVQVALALSEDNVHTDKITNKRLLYPNRQMFRNLSRLQEIKQWMEEKRIDLIIAEHSYTGWMAWRLSKMTGRPFIIHSHNIESRRFRKMKKWWWPIYHRYESWIHRKADSNFFISEEDRQLAIREFGVDASKTHVITYGITRKPVSRDKTSLRQSLSLPADKTILLFNGTLDYEPNYEAVINIIEKLEPQLRSSIDNYIILITGNRAPAELAQRMLAAPHLEYLGYVEDVHLYYQAADLFINPVANDTGVKTKLIEAIANNCTTVSTEAGASGIQKELCGEKLHIVPDNDWKAFSGAIATQLRARVQDTPERFYEAYSWEAVTREAAGVIHNFVRQTPGA